MTNRLQGFWHPERSSPGTGAGKNEKRGRVRLSIVVNTKVMTRSKSNTTIKLKPSSMEEFGVWLGKNYAFEAQDLIGSLRKGLVESGQFEKSRPEGSRT